MRGWGKVMFCMMIMAVMASSAILGRNIWGQYVEQAAFVSLKKDVERDKAESGKEGFEIMDENETASEERKILPEYESLVKKNPDFVGWISIEGTRIDYPVMQVIGDREYYLHRNFEKEDSYAGVPFVGNGDLRRGQGNIFIYGHNMRNGTMFADLLNYRKKEYWEQYPIIYLDSLYEHLEYQIFTAFYTNEEEWEQEESLMYDILRSNSMMDSKCVFLLEKAGVYDTGIRPELKNPLLFLVTCSYQEEGGRFIIGGVQI